MFLAISRRCIFRETQKRVITTILGSSWPSRERRETSLLALPLLCRQLKFAEKYIYNVQSYVPKEGRVNDHGRGLPQLVYIVSLCNVRIFSKNTTSGKSRLILIQLEGQQGGQQVAERP